MIKMKLIIITVLCISIKYILCLTKPVDLTWGFDSSTPYWKGIQPFQFKKQVAQNTSAGYFYSQNEFCAGEHGGTHLDAPYHFYEKGLKVGDIPLSKLIVPGILIDLEKERGVNLEERHLKKWIGNHGEFPTNSVVLVRFGWSKHYSNKTLYFGIDENNNFNFPGVTKSAAEFLVNSNKIIGIGLDTPSVDPGNSETYDSHRIFSANNIYILENVKLLINLPAANFTLFVMPMKILEGTGAPLRLIATPNVNF